MRGAQAKKFQRIKLTEEIQRKAENEIKVINREHLWILGTALYWAEGSKEKEYHPGSPVIFTNSDYRMIQVFLKWLKVCCEVSEDQIRFEIYIHENDAHRIHDVKKFWSGITSSDIMKFDKVRFKKNKINSVRKNKGNLYNGCLRVGVKASSSLNRRISGWINGIIKKI